MKLRNILSLWLLALLTGCMPSIQWNAANGFGKTGCDDSDTVNSITQLNPTGGSYGGTSYPSQLYNFLADEDANRWYEQGFGNLVSTVANSHACLGATGTGLTMTPTACVAYNAGFRSTETGSITFPNNVNCWVAMDENTSGNNSGIPTFTRVAGTHYLTDCSGDSEPTMASDTQLLMDVTTLSGAITAVTDERTTGLELAALSVGALSSPTGTLFINSPTTLDGGLVSVTGTLAANTVNPGQIGWAGGADLTQIRGTRAPIGFTCFSNSGTALNCGIGGGVAMGGIYYADEAMEVHSLSIYMGIAGQGCSPHPTYAIYVNGNEEASTLITEVDNQNAYVSNGYNINVSQSQPIQVKAVAGVNAGCSTEPADVSFVVAVSTN